MSNSRPTYVITNKNGQIIRKTQITITLTKKEKEIICIGLYSLMKMDKIINDLLKQIALDQDVFTGECY